MAQARKPLFSRPAWAAKSATSPEEPSLKSERTSLEQAEQAQIFSNKHVYEDIVAQERMRREKHAQRVKERELKVSRERTSPGDAIEVGNTKKRRISSNHDHQTDGGEDESEDQLNNGLCSAGGRSSALPQKGTPTHTNESKSRSKHPQRGNSDSPTTRRSRQRIETTDVVALDSEEEVGDVSRSKRSPQAKRMHARSTKIQQSAVDPDSEEEDEYLRELKRKAREDARLKKLGVTTSGTGSTATLNRPISSGSHAPAVGIIESPDQEQRQLPKQSTSTLLSDDPEIKILIETIIPNAKPLIVNRRASQSLDLVRAFWCERNKLNPAILPKVFLTWRGTRLYNSSTVRGILEMLKKTHPTSDGSDPSKGKIVLEAMTDEIFEYRRMQQQRKQKEMEAAADEDENEVATSADKKQPNLTHDETEDVPQAQKSGPVVKLVCPGFEAMEIRLRLDTTVAKIVAAFRAQRQVNPKQQCWLSYDGDRLESHQTVKDIGLEMDDCIEVYIR